MGNSIDGFTVASVVAALSLLTENGLSTVQCDGLVLMNSAGNIIKDSGLTDAPFENIFPVFKGPSSQMLRTFGVVMFPLLQSRIEQILAVSNEFEYGEIRISGWYFKRFSRPRGQ